MHLLRDLLPEGPLPLRDLAFEDFFPWFCVCGFGAGADERVDCFSLVFPSLFFSFWPQNVGLWLSDPRYSSPWSSISDSLANCSVQNLVRTVPILFRVDQTHVFAFCASSPEYRPGVPDGLKITLHSTS